MKPPREKDIDSLPLLGRRPVSLVAKANSADFNLK